VRDIFGPGQTQALRDVIQSILVAELLSPSKEIWLFFAWLSDVEVVDNTARQFGSICPDWPAAQIRLSQVLETLLSRGSHINIVLRKTAHNDAIVSQLLRLRQQYGANVRWCQRETFHDKGILGDDYLLDGSMNLTYNGISTNDEHVWLHRDPASIASRRVGLRGTWESQLE
jgi:phosphatidylserine/phosphatidylglycerophosphate/cardiolipin synthase-like enzyme